MLCKKVLSLLSEYFDEVLDPDTAFQVSQHLDQCLSCRREYKSLSELHNTLRSLNKVQAPEYLQRLVQHRVSAMQRDSWRIRLQNDLERRWSKIRTIDGTWYITRILGTAMACFLFLVIASSMAPFLSVNAQTPERSRLVPTDYFSQVGLSVLSTFGLLPKQDIAIAPEQKSKSDAAMSDEYLLDFGQRVSQEGEDDSFMVLADVDEKGAAKIRSVPEYPEDTSLLNSFHEMIVAARCRPAVKNGQTVPSNLIFLFNKISVYN
jgi:hypothetical protein